MTDKHRRRELAKWATLILLPVALYVGSYCALVERDFAFGWLPIPNYTKRLPMDENARWTWNWDRLMPFFTPIHTFDRRLRPHLWIPPPPADE